MSWSEFCSLLSGIMPDTPLGAIVEIRAEKDPEIIKKMTPQQSRIRKDWIIRRNQKLKEDANAYNDYWKKFQEWAKNTFS